MTARSLQCLRCVVDTNVATTANQRNPAAPADCVAASAAALNEVMKRGHVFLDDGGRIMEEYRRNLSGKGEPGAGDAFLKWLLTEEWSGKRVTRIMITSRPDEEEDFVELPVGNDYDPSDRKFLAVAAASPKHPPVLQALDSKWWGWQDELREIGVKIHFLCPDAIKQKYEKKMGS